MFLVYVELFIVFLWPCIVITVQYLNSRTLPRTMEQGQDQGLGSCP